MKKHLLVAPDSFKGSLSAHDICSCVERVIARQNWPVTVISRPMSDGGEGFVDAFVYSGLAEAQSVWVTDPLGRPIRVNFAWQPQTQTAIIEMAQASGLPLLSSEERNPLVASTFGTGLVINAAVALGAQKIVLGLGGSATNDGGAGALQAMGFGLLNAKNDPIALGGKGLCELSKIRQNSPGLAEINAATLPENELSISPASYEKLKTIEWVIACDVSNPLLGEQGATAVFGPQKGVTAKNHSLLETCLTHYADLIQKHFKQDVRNIAGAGAAGGMAGGFVGFLNAKLVSGFTLLASLLDFEAVFDTYPIDLVITAEGKIDSQTQYGKLPYQIANLATKHQAPCIGVCGKLDADLTMLPAFFDLVSIHQAMPNDTSLEELMAKSNQNLEQTLIDYLPQWLKL